jgi:hypothetical protein
VINNFFSAILELMIWRDGAKFPGWIFQKPDERGVKMPPERRLSWAASFSIESRPVIER